jgi:ATP/maltotriose-dependent transcriptional regulator MalT
LRRDYDTLVGLGELYYRPYVAVLLAQTLYAQGKLDEAEDLARTGAEIAAEDDIESQAVLRSVTAKILARRGDVGEGVRLAREATALLAKTDDILARTEALVDLAEVLRAAGDEDDALIALDEALELCRDKQMTIQTERVEDLLDPLRPRSVPQRA